MVHKLLACTSLVMLMGLSIEARADCVSPADCICPSFQPTAVLEGKIRTVNSPTSGRAQLQVIAVVPAGAQIPYAPGDVIEVTQYAKSGTLTAGNFVLAPVYHDDFTGKGKTYEIADMLAFDADGKITCRYAPELRLSRVEALRIIQAPVSQCYDEMVKLGVNDNFECNDTSVGCMASVGGSRRGRGGAGLLLVLGLVGLLLAWRRRGAQPVLRSPWATPLRVVPRTEVICSRSGSPAASARLRRSRLTCSSESGST
jgi:hypothetical protein